MHTGTISIIKTIKRKRFETRMCEPRSTFPRQVVGYCPRDTWPELWTTISPRFDYLVYFVIKRNRKEYIGTWPEFAVFRPRGAARRPFFFRRDAFGGKSKCSWNCGDFCHVVFSAIGNSTIKSFCVSF